MATPQPPLDATPATPGVVLAGGLSRRMGGGDKAARIIGGRSILVRVIDRLAPQCDGLVLNANGDPGRFAAFGLPVIRDTIEGHPGPLAGILAALEWAATSKPGADDVLIAAADTPFLPRDLVVRLQRQRVANDAPIAIAASGGRSHPVVGLWSVGLRHALRRTLETEPLRGVHKWIARHAVATVEWPTEPLDPFFNVNTAEDAAQAEHLAALDGG